MQAANVVRRKISLFTIMSKREVDKIFNLIDEAKKRQPQKPATTTRPTYVRAPPVDDHIAAAATAAAPVGPSPYALDPALLSHTHEYDPWLSYASASSDFLIRKYHLQPFLTVESARSIGMHAFETTGAERTPLETQDSTCCFPAKTTGLASLCVQLTALVISVLITIFFFYQIGGLDEIGITQNSTTLLIEDEAVGTIPPVDTTIRLLKNLVGQVENDTANYYDFRAPFRNASVVVPGVFESDAYDLIRLSTLIYLILAVAWMLSLVMLLFSIKVETLELVVANGFIALVAALYLVVHAIFIVLLVVYKFPPPLALRPSIIIFGSAAIQLLCTALAFFGMLLLFGWYKCIVYVRGGERCPCIAAFTRCCTKKKRNPTQEYAMPEVTAARNLPMDRDFSNF
ncbi:hypothetical protein PFISCL1PPCAC_26643 [Pristionchus fissidentatus]|uniref:Uncharacterized protein n=1 Tax=Pristionchus fissidentatus TaxID=1538716 RepID=A0AAV5WW79_9BILA|nr:hypothetical protein PFISCL1PPCAC_26643 [Pristionchus fissidentatus]